MESSNGKYVPWKVFIWCVSIVSALILGAFAVANGGVMIGQENKVEIRGLSSDNSNFRESLQRIEKKIDDLISRQTSVK